MELWVVGYAGEEAEVCCAEHPFQFGRGRLGIRGFESSASRR